MPGAVRLAPDGTAVFVQGEALDPDGVALCGETEPRDPLPITPSKAALELRVVHCSLILDTEFGYVLNDVLLFSENDLRAFPNVHRTEDVVPASTSSGSGT